MHDVYYPPYIDPPFQHTSIVCYIEQDEVDRTNEMVVQVVAVPSALAGVRSHYETPSLLLKHFNENMKNTDDCKTATSLQVVIEHHLTPLTDQDGHNAFNRNLVDSEYAWLQAKPFMDQLAEVIARIKPNNLNKFKFYSADLSGLTHSNCNLFVKKLAALGVRTSDVKFGTMPAHSPSLVSLSVCSNLRSLSLDMSVVNKTELTTVLISATNLVQLRLCELRMVDDEGQPILAYEDDDSFIVVLRNLHSCNQIEIYDSEFEENFHFKGRDVEWITTKKWRNLFDLVFTHEAYLNHAPLCNEYDEEENVLGAIFDFTRQRHTCIKNLFGDTSK